MTRPAADVLAVVLLLAAIWVWASPPAHAHTQVVASDPANGAVLVEPPRAVTLTFAAERIGPLPLVTVYDPDGAPVSTDPLQYVWPDSIRVPLNGLTKPGRYTTHYRTASGELNGILWFELAGAPGDNPDPADAPAAASAASDSPADEQGPGWPWIVVGLAAVGASAAGLIRLKRESPWW